MSLEGGVIPKRRILSTVRRQFSTVTHAQILACWHMFPPYLASESFLTKEVIHKRRGLSTVIPYFSTSYVIKIRPLSGDTPHICLQKDTKKRKRDPWSVPFPLVAAALTVTRVLSQLSHDQARCDIPLRLYNLSRIASTSRRTLSSLSMA